MTDLNVTAQLEVDDGTGSSRQFSVADLQVAQTGAAKESTLTAGLGTDGASPPTIIGTGARGWLRAIYEKLSSGLTVTVTNPGGGSSVDVSTLAKDATLTGGTARTQVTNFPATQPVSGTVAVSNPTTNPETGLAKDATLTTLVGGPGSGVATITGSGSGIQGLLRMIWDTLRGSLTVTAAALTDGTQRIGGTVLVASTSATATESNVASSTSNGTLLASNTARKGWSVFNDSTSVLYIKFGATASATSHTVQVAAGGYYESPQLVYTGQVDGLWASANGNARVTELT